MLVQAILELIQYLNDKPEQTSFNADFCKKLEQRFGALQAQQPLSQEDIRFIKQCCEERRNSVEACKTQDLLGATDYWINFLQQITLHDNLNNLVQFPVEPKQNVHPCWILIISLLTTRFEVSSFDKKNVSLWDRKNQLGKEPNRLFEELSPAIKSNRRVQVEEAYAKSVKKIVDEELNKVSLSSFCTRYHSTTDWLVHVKNETLQAHQNIYWFESEVFLAALLSFKTDNYDLEMKVNEFLDQLIRTCTQREEELQKVVRVNCLFRVLMSGLNVQSQQLILQAISAYQHQGQAPQFINDSIYFINKRLAQLSVSIAPKDGYRFFNMPYQSQKLSFEASLYQLNTFIDVINAFKHQLELIHFELDSVYYDKFLKYLQELSTPILTVAEVERAERSVNASGYLGAWT